MSVSFKNDFATSVIKASHPSFQSQQLKANIEKTKAKIAKLKNELNPKLLQKLRKLQKQIQRLEIVNVNSSNIDQNKLLLQDFLQSEKQQQAISSIDKSLKDSQSLISNQMQFQPEQRKKLQTFELNNLDQLKILKNITTNSFVSPKKQTSTVQTPSHQSEIVKEQFSPQTYLKQQQQKISPNVMQTQIYPILNRYLSAKSTLISKLIQLNPQKRHNNSLLVSHQRVMLKEHLDMTRRIIEDLQRKNSQVQTDLSRDFIIVKNKWAQSQRQLRQLTSENQVKN